MSHRKGENPEIIVKISRSSFTPKFVNFEKAKSSIFASKTRDHCSFPKDLDNKT
jgi:hypothetical protein